MYIWQKQAEFFVILDKSDVHWGCAVILQQPGSFYIWFNQRKVGSLCVMVLYSIYLSSCFQGTLDFDELQTIFSSIKQQTTDIHITYLNLWIKNFDKIIWLAATWCQKSMWIWDVSEVVISSTIQIINFTRLYLNECSTSFMAVFWLVYPVLHDEKNVSTTE